MRVQRNFYFKSLVKNYLPERGLEAIAGSTSRVRLECPTGFLWKTWTEDSKPRGVIFGLFFRPARLLMNVCTSLTRCFVRKSPRKAVKWKFAIGMQNICEVRACFSGELPRIFFFPAHRFDNDIWPGSRTKKRNRHAIADTESHHVVSK